MRGCLIKQHQGQKERQQSRGGLGPLRNAATHADAACTHLQTQHVGWNRRLWHSAW